MPIKLVLMNAQTMTRIALLFTSLLLALPGYAEFEAELKAAAEDISAKVSAWPDIHANLFVEPRIPLRISREHLLGLKLRCKLGWPTPAW